MKEIPDFPGYFADEGGNIWSTLHWRRGTNREYKKLSPCESKDGVLRVNLRRDKKDHSRSVHRLVLEAFVGPRPKGKECCHYDGNPLNNTLKNLRWDTRQSNIADKIRHGTAKRGEECNLSVLTENQVIDIIELIRNGVSHTKIAEMYNVDVATVRCIRRGETWDSLKRPWLTPPSANFVAHGNAKLSEAQVVDVIHRLHSGESTGRIAKAYNVSKVAVKFIKQNKTWSHIARPWEDDTKLRPYRGEGCGQDKLKEAEVREILSKLSSGGRPADLAKAYNISRSTIYAIKAEKIWKHIPR